MMELESIIINRIYAGQYLVEQEKSRSKGISGGEVVNLLQSDDGVNYCQILPWGFFNPDYDDTVCAVLHTRLLAAGCFEVLGVSIIDCQLFHKNDYIKRGDEKRAEKGKNAANVVKAYAKKTPIKYGGYSYVKESDEYPAVTFKSKRLLFPKRPIYILDEKYSKELSGNVVSFRLKNITFSRQSLHMYVNNRERPEAFATASEMIENEALWEERDARIDRNTDANHFNFLTLIGKENDELAISNMFAYFFSNYHDLFVDFAKTILKTEISENYTVTREYNHVDLWIEDDDEVIVIENKVKSGINGISPRHDFSKGGPVESQLSKYYEKAQNYKREHAKIKKVSCFLFVPNYNRLDLSEFEKGNKYKVIRYREIYKFLMKKTVDSRYYADFCDALYKHTKDVPNDYSESLLIYLKNEIEKEKRK